MKTKNSTLFLVFFTILLVRILPVIITAAFSSQGYITGHGDQFLYIKGAQAILSHGVNPFTFFPPLTFLFIAEFLLLGNSITVPLCAMALVGWVTVMAVYLLAKTLFDERTALIAAVLCGVYPNFIYYGASLNPETLANFLIVCSMLMLAKYFKSARFFYLFLGGILWGFASQTRGGLHFFTVFIALAIAVSHFKSGWRTIGMPIVVFFLSTYITIFSIGILAAPVQGDFELNSGSGMGSVVHGANRLISCSTDYGNIRGNIFYHINNSKQPWPEGSQIFTASIIELPTGKLLLRVADFVWKDPGTYLLNSLTKVSNLWATNQYVIGFIKTRSFHRFYNQKSLLLFADAICLLISLLYIFIVCGGLWGLAAGKNELRLVFTLFIIFYTVMIFFSVGNSKLRLPMMPFFIIYCSYFFSQVKLRRVSLKKTVFNKWLMIIMIVFLCNGIYKYREIVLSPSEVSVRQVELCNELGFPKTAAYLLDMNKGKHYSQNQTSRLRSAAEISNAPLKTNE
jgi:4-amino-4-deoxy-L-arabinose transferase-like glycosyltransferase